MPKEAGPGAHTGHPRIQNTEKGRSQVGVLPGLQSETPLFQKEKKKKEKKRKKGKERKKVKSNKHPLRNAKGKSPRVQDLVRVTKVRTKLHTQPCQSVLHRRRKGLVKESARLCLVDALREIFKTCFAFLFCI